MYSDGRSQTVANRPKAVTPKVHDVAVAEKKRHLLIVTNK